MALFGRNKEKKEVQKAKKEEAIFDQEQSEIDAVEGKYLVKLFSDLASGKYGILNMYEDIANFANRHNLTIVNIAKPEDGFMRDGVTVIYEKDDY